MRETRRRFLMTLAAAASCSAATDGSVLAQVHNTKPFPNPPQSAETQNPAEAASAKSDPQNAKRVALQQNEKEFRAGVERLFRLASELKQEVDKTVTTEIFSVQMYKRTEEIEKVAKLLKSKAKG
jgi:flagellar motility protein MotE (MotC chaperone)